eukprot:CAMPEP_0114351812 /NCGR_PEP_ID=MMETSP0101-20121206/17476_1 /TAXON_ID=38822 ORGANISM="Pteridomonas danica, Strain PT" /NCGR_SAMPLE_ID=MMETSP0101 /ASSEMBLY_ACC=CAM_ASM_000211 /LENGTH=434 /DNA_ID=CAMNT_0001491899 /DNA_START=233 /DNA_END=1537 /DNA_ORIENTATION=+
MAFGGSADSLGIVPNFEHYFIKKGTYAFWLFRWAFVSTAATIVSGAVAERIKFKAYVGYAILMGIFTYPILAHWAWSDQGVFSRTKDDPLFGCGVLDFGGAGVVHMTGGISALIAVVIMGPRASVSYEKGLMKAPPGQSDVFKTLGTLTLWFGWFGFNGTSLGAIVGSADTAARAMVMTTIASGTGGITSGIIWMKMNGNSQININPALNGTLAGLVGITANAATVETEGAFLIGITAAIAYTLGVGFLDKFVIDDVVEAVPVHLFCGTWSMIAAGFFTSPTLYKDAFGVKSDRSYKCAGLFYGGSGSQLGANLFFMLIQIVWVFATIGVLFYVLNVYGALRVSSFTEKIGVDMMLHNENIAGDADDMDAVHRSSTVNRYRGGSETPPLDDEDSVVGMEDPTWVTSMPNSSKHPSAKVAPSPSWSLDNADDDEL